MILFLFFCSGATALIYEVLWSKYLSLMFGSTVQAQTVVLAVFMGGLALGNRLFGKRADALNRPLRVYGYIEIAIGLYAFFFSGIYNLADAVFVKVGSSILDRSWLLLGLKATLSVALLLGPTVLMGGTLPLLAAWLQKNGVEPGRLSARFYSVNSLGAVCGAGLAGFFLVRQLGMVSTSQMTALANVLIGATAIGLARHQREGETISLATDVPVQSQTQSTAARWAAALVMVTGGVSMGLEVLASRAMSLLFGSSLQSFAIVLMAFILGIGLGSSLIASSRFKRWKSEKVATTLLLAAAIWIGLLIFRIESWVEYYRWARTGLSRNEVGYLLNQLLSGFIAMVILGVPAALLGAVLPLLMRVVSEDAKTLGDKIGRLLTWNTLGAVGGVLATGFVLMPQIGLRNSFATLAMVLGLVAATVAFVKHHRRLAIFSTGVIGLLLMLFLTGTEGWKYVFSSGVFRSRETVFDPQAMDVRRKLVEILFYEDAPDATVSVEHNLKIADSISLRINGKPDASTGGDLLTQYLCAHLPMAARPDAKEVFVLGMGSGVTAGAVLGHPVERVTIAENCEPVLRTAHFFAKYNNGVMTNARSRIWVEDARTILKLSPQEYDLIILEPSNPWTVGVGSVFSQEFYRLVSTRLKEDGIVVQWFHIYEMHDGIVSMVLRTFNSVYPFTEVWDCGWGDIIMLGARQPWKMDLANYGKIFERELPRQQLESAGLKTPEVLLARQLASQRTAFAIAGEGAIQSDWFPILEYEAPKAFYTGVSSPMLGDFDERTIQTSLAPEGKRTALRSLSNSALKDMFANYGSINVAFLQLVKLRLNTNSTAAAESSLASLPSVLRSLENPPSPLKAPENASERLKELIQAANQLEANPDQRREAIQQIETILGAYREPDSQKASQWTPSFFAVLGARHSLGLGDYASARRLIELGRKIGPADAQLEYLARIVEREQSMNSKLVSSRN
jgi:spermidine synthase